MIDEALLPHKCGLHRCVNISDHGDAIYDPPLADPPALFSSRVDFTRKEVLNKDGNKVISEAKVITNTQLHPLDIVIYDGRQWPVISCTPCDGIFGGTNHYEVRM